MLYNHHLNLTHRRSDMASALGDPAPADSTVDVDVDSTDLTAAWAELLSRLPSDVYAALKQAMGDCQEKVDTP